MSLSREAFEADKERYEREIRDLTSQGFEEGHYLVERARRRLETVNRVLTDSAYGLVEE